MLLLLWFAALLQAAWSQCSGGIPATEVADFLSVHNTLRAKITAGTYVDGKGKTMPPAAVPIPDYTWDCALEAQAQAWANQCNYSHTGGAYGENLYKSMSSAPQAITGKGKAASDKWEKEFQDFGWLDIKLTDEVFNTGIGHATQMAWAGSTKLGCGMKLCNADKDVIVVCQYLAQGNYLNQNIYSPLVSTVATSAPPSQPSQCSAGIPATEVSDFLSVHNTLRAKITAGTYVAKGKAMPPAATPIPDYTWDCALEAQAQAWANQCNYSHTGGAYGENLYKSMSSAPQAITGKGKAASDAWEKEFQDFGWLDIKLTEAVFNTGIGHATQMAWAGSTKLGCGMKLCNADKDVIVVCQYLAQGNYLDQNIYTPGVVTTAVLGENFPDLSSSSMAIFIASRPPEDNALSVAPFRIECFRQATINLTIS